MASAGKQAEAFPAKDYEDTKCFISILFSSFYIASFILSAQAWATLLQKANKPYL